MYVTAYVKDASYFNLLTVSEDGQIQNIETRSKYGASNEKAIAYLSNPTHQDELESVKTKVEKNGVNNDPSISINKITTTTK